MSTPSAAPAATIEDFTCAIHYMAMLAMAFMVDGREPPSWYTPLLFDLRARGKDIKATETAAAMMQAIERAVGRSLTPEEHAFFLQCKLRAAKQDGLTV